MNDVIERVATWSEASSIVRTVIRKIDSVFHDMFGEDHNIDGEILVSIDHNKNILPEGKIAAYNHNTRTIILGTKLFENGLLETAIKHELIHAAIGESDSPHGSRFQKLADYLGIPDKFQD